MARIHRNTIVRAALGVALVATCVLAAGCSTPKDSAPSPKTSASTATNAVGGSPASGISQGAKATTTTGAAAATVAANSAETSTTAVAVSSTKAKNEVVPAYDLLPASASRRAAAARVGVPVLMYHAIGDVVPDGRDETLYVSTADFTAQMDYLAKNGYQPVTLQRVFDFWAGRATLPKRPIVLTFDDGFQSDYTYVAPLLAKRRWPAILFLIEGRHKRRMYPSVVRALITDGWEIDSHTISHQDLPTLSSAQITHEVADSRRWFQQQYSIPCNFFCYPSGRFDARSLAAVKAAGYLGATTTRLGLAHADEPYTMNRIRVGHGEALSDFANALRLAR